MSNNTNTNTNTNKLVIVGVVIILVIIGSYRFSWSGFGESTTINSSTITEKQPENKGVEKITKKTTTDKLESAKTLWDWIGLLIPPVMVAYLGWFFKDLQDKAQGAAKKDADDKATDQQHEVTLQDYLKILSEFTVDKKLMKILEPKAADFPNIIDPEAAISIITAKTLSLLRLFKSDIERKASVLSFLGDSGLLKNLTHLDLSELNFTGANLKKANLRGIILPGVIFTSANLTSADLTKANLNKADFTSADLTKADFKEANLTEAKFGKAILSETDFRGALYEHGDFTIANLISFGFKEEELTKSNVKFGKIKIREEVCLRSDAQKITYDFTVRIKSGSKLGQIFVGFFSYDPSSHITEKEGEELITVSEIKFDYMSIYDQDKPNIVLDNKKFKRLEWVGGIPTQRFGFNDGFNREQFGRDEEAFVRNKEDYFGYLDRNTYVDGVGRIEYKLRKTT
ncbi:pentapeptide repeat-containing protein [Nostoc sp. C117]|uniref:pentapeptide repeat-containing protein n=1 Tax=Nostoc sp. C117 TaxID=3349875 RepID=UPI00370DC2FF